MKLCFALTLLLFLLSCRQPYQSGEAAYQGECAKCHTINGEGGSKGPDLSDIFSKKDEKFIRQYTVDPRSLKGDSTMPPSKISDEELDMLIEYMKTRSRSTKE